MAELPESLILAGGLGTRLKSRFAEIPKPLVPVGGRPVLEYPLEDLARHGFCRIVLLIGHLGERIEAVFGDGSDRGLSIDYAREPALLGTAGALGNARELVASECFLALNGDSLLPELDYARLLEGHRRRAAVDPDLFGTLVVVRPPDAGAYGVVELGGDGDIARFCEKAPVEPSSSLISGGVYVLDRRVFERIPREGASSIEFDLFPGLLAEGKKLASFHHEGFFGDMGTPEGHDRVESHYSDLRTP